MEVTDAPRRPSSFMKSIFMTRPPNNVPNCNANSGQMDHHMHHDDPELQDPAVPPRPLSWIFRSPHFLWLVLLLPGSVCYKVLSSLLPTQGPSRQPAHPLPHHPLRLPGRQNHVWTHRRPWRNRLCPTCSYLVCSHRRLLSQVAGRSA